MGSLVCELTLGQLRTADILATKSKSVNSAAIRAATCSPFSHALLMISPNRAIEAIPSGGVMRKELQDLRDQTRDGQGKILVLRHRSLSCEQGRQVASYALRQTGKGYDTLGAGRTAYSTGCNAQKLNPILIKITIVDEYGELTNEAHDKTFYCSELVARAFEQAGAPLSKYRARNVSPGALLKAETLLVVGQLI